MALILPFKSLLFAILRLIKNKLQKEVARASGFSVKQLGALERGENKRPISSPELARILTAMGCSRAEVVLTTSFLEGLAALDPYADEEQAATIEETVASMARRLRRRLRMPGTVDTSEYPAPYEVALDRAEARKSWERLRPLETLAEMSLVTRVAREFQGWAMVELLCDESERAASKCVERARILAQVAVEIAQNLRVPEGWQRRLLGYAMAHLANTRRVAGDFDVADVTLTEAKRLWETGSDPDQLLDPGRLLDLEASLRRGQRQFDQCLYLLEQAAAVTRRPEHVALKRAFTLEVMGDYGQAIEILVELAPRVENHPEPRLKTIQRFNLCVNLTHVQRYREAALLFPSVRRLAEELQDELDCIRARWLEGRVAAGLGHPEAALRALEEARRAFAKRSMHYDVMLSLLETAALLLKHGELAEVQRLAGELAPLFESKGIHQKALAALRLFEEAVTRQAATAFFARRLLAYFFRARHDKELQFSPTVDIA
jgi:tetratricopeptide (TPR) repeat protein